MAMTTVERKDAPSIGKTIVQGASAGVVGGIVFGIMMAMMGMLPKVGMLVGHESAVVGFIVHLGISAFSGAVYGLIISCISNAQTMGLDYGWGAGSHESVSIVVEIIIELVIRAFIGAVYGLLNRRFSATFSLALTGGLVNGIIWWFLGALVLMPLMLGEMEFVVGQAQWISLLGHLIYGVITALVFVALRRR